MRDRITEFTTFVKRSRSLRSSVRTNPARERELLEEASHALNVFSDVGVDFSVDTFEIGLRENSGGTVT